MPASTSECGRGITCVLRTSPTLRPAAAPASTAAFTAPTSPRTIAVTNPASIFSQPTSVTFADFTAASAASIIATKPRHSIIPKASRSIGFPQPKSDAIVNSLLVGSHSRYEHPAALLEGDFVRLNQYLAIFRKFPLVHLLKVREMAAGLHALLRARDDLVSTPLRL